MKRSTLILLILALTSIIVVNVSLFATFVQIPWGADPKRREFQRHVFIFDVIYLNSCVVIGTIVIFNKLRRGERARIAGSPLVDRFGWPITLILFVLAAFIVGMVCHEVAEHYRPRAHDIPGP
jgi:hypothetical protein